MKAQHAFFNGIHKSPDAVATQRALRLLEAAISQLAETIAELQTRIDRLENRVEALEE